MVTKTDSQAQKSLEEASRKSQGVFALSVTVLHANRRQWRQKKTQKTKMTEGRQKEDRRKTEEDKKRQKKTE